MSIKNKLFSFHKKKAGYLCFLFCSEIWFSFVSNICRTKILHTFNSTLIAKEQVINSASTNCFAGNNIISELKCKPHGQYLVSMFI